MTYAYDLLGRPTSVTQTGNALSFTYDALSRLLTETGPQGTLTSTWDAGGRRTRLEWPDGFYVNYDYDVLGEMTRVRENGATSGVGVLASYAYDDLGNRTGATYGNGTSSSWTPDPLSRLAGLTHNLAGTTSDLTKTFTYNPASQIASVTSSNDTYAWDAAANVNRSYTANGLNQYTLSGSTSLGYDARGNLTSSGSDSYTYSSENLLETGPGSTTLTYDPLLRLYQVSKGSATTRFAYDGLEMVAEYNASNALQKRYVFGPGTDEPIVQYAGAGTTSRTWLHADERGSIIALTTASGGTTIDSYDEYGIPGSGNTGRFQYTGQMWIPEIGLYYYKARMYSLSLGRFMQTDPIGYADGLNWYNYVGSDPINFVDPMGLGTQYCADGTIAVQNKIENCYGEHGGPGDIVTDGGGSGGGPGDFGGFSHGGGNGGSTSAGGGGVRFHGIGHLPSRPTPQKSLFRKFVDKAVCGLSSLVPGNRIRLGADAAFGLGGIIGGGTGVSIEDSGRIVFDAYGQSGPGIGGIAGAGLTLDDNSTPDGWSSQKAFTLQGAYYIGVGYTNSNGDEKGSLSATIGPKAGALIGYTISVSHGSTLYDAQCK